MYLCTYTFSNSSNSYIIIKCKFVLLQFLNNLKKKNQTNMANRDQNALDATRAQVNEVQNIMKNNVDKIMEREGKLSDLEGRADQLQVWFVDRITIILSKNLFVEEKGDSTNIQKIWTLVMNSSCM